MKKSYKPLSSPKASIGVPGLQRGFPITTSGMTNALCFGGAL
jgi:hypothetical protein